MRYLGYIFLLSFMVLSFSFTASAEKEVHQDDIVVGNVFGRKDKVQDPQGKVVSRAHCAVSRLYRR